jgi:hypothetical protein
LILLGLAISVFSVSAGIASATPGKTTTCVSCHSGAAAGPSAVLAAPITGSTATYNVSAAGASYIAVFNGITKVTQVTGASGSITVPTGKTYTLYAVTGPTTGSGLSTLSLVVPAAPPVVLPPVMPVLSASFNTAINSVTISWSAVSGATSYDYQVGSGPTQSTTGNSVVLSNLALGTTAFKVRATNTAGSSSYAAANVVYSIPTPGAPVLLASYATANGSIVISWSTVAGATSYDYILGTASAQNTVANSVTLSGLNPGSTVFQLRSVNAGGSSAYVSSNIIYTVPPVPVAPAPPTLDAAYPTSSSNLVVNWSAVDGATSYQYQLNGGAIVGLTSPSVDLTGLNEGDNALLVRSVNNVGSSDWSATTVTYVVPVATAPAAPVLKASYASTSDSYLLSWVAVDGATGYRVSVNGAEAVVVADPSITLAGLLSGGNTVSIVAFNDTGDSPAATTTVNFNTAPQLVATHLTLRSSQSHGRSQTMAMFSGRLLTSANRGLTHRTVGLYRFDGQSWILVKSVRTSSNGSYMFNNMRLRTPGQYRVSFLGDSAYAASDSAVVTIAVRGKHMDSRNSDSHEMMD